MARHLIVNICSDPQRLQARHDHIRRAGYYALAAPTIARALHLTFKVRPALIVSDRQLSDGHVSIFVQRIRTITALRDVPVVVVQRLSTEEQKGIEDDRYLFIREIAGDEDIVAIVGGHLAAENGSHTSWAKGEATAYQGPSETEAGTGFKEPLIQRVAITEVEQDALTSRPKSPLDDT